MFSRLLIFFSLSLSFPFLLYFYVAVVSRNVYDAFLYYLVNHNSGMSVDWDAAVLRKYVDEHNSKDDQPLDFKLESHRRNFIRKASRYDVLDVNGKKFFSKLEKGEKVAAGGKSVFVKKHVICLDEYDRLLQDHHDKKNHLGYIKCYYEVSQPPCTHFCYINFWFGLTSFQPFFLLSSFTIFLDETNLLLSQFQYLASVYQQLPVVSNA